MTLAILYYKPTDIKENHKNRPLKIRERKTISSESGCLNRGRTFPW